MSRIVKFTIDGRECLAEVGIYILAAARENGIYIPTLCNLDDIKPRGACRVCNVKVNGRWMTACTTPVTEGMEIENDTPSAKAFNDTYRKGNEGRPPSDYGAYGYAGVGALLEGTKKAGSTDADKVIEAMESLKYDKYKGDLKGTEVEVTTADETSISVGVPTVAAEPEPVERKQGKECKDDGGGCQEKPGFH